MAQAIDPQPIGLIACTTNTSQGSLSTQTKITSTLVITDHISALSDFRVEAFPGVKKYMEAEGYMKKGPFFSKRAGWGGYSLD